MSIRYLLALLAVVGLTFGMYAQNVVASQEITVNNDTRYELFAGGEDQVVLYRDEPGSVMLEAYSPRMDKVWERDLSLDKGRPKPIGAVTSDGEITVFYTYRKDRGLHLKLQRYSARGNLTDSLTVAELDGDFQVTDWVLTFDPTNRYAIFSRHRDANAHLLMAVEVATGRLLYQVSLKPEFATPLNNDLNPIHVDELGAVYVWTQDNNRRSKLNEHVLRLTRLSLEGESTTTTIDLAGILVYSLTLANDYVNNRVVMAGYTAEDPDEASGSLVISLPYSLEGDATVYMAPFSEAMILAVDQKSRKVEGIRDLQALNVHFTRNGTTLIIGEQRKETIRTVGNRGSYFGGSLKTDYLYEDIILSSIGPKGEGAWQEVLPKKQFSQDDAAAFSSYFLAESPRQLRLIYNDEVRSGGTVSEYTLTGAGEIERHSLMNTEYKDLWLRLGAGVQLDGSTVVIPSERRNRLKLVRVSF